MSTWAYEDYSEWSRLLARTCDEKTLMARLKKAERERDRAKEAHFRAIQRTTSMASQSQARAQSRTSMVAKHEEASALRDALEIQRTFQMEQWADSAKEIRNG